MVSDLKVWTRYCGTGGKPAGNREDKHQPIAAEGPGLLDQTRNIPGPKILGYHFNSLLELSANLVHE